MKPMDGADLLFLSRSTDPQRNITGHFYHSSDSF